MRICAISDTHGKHEEVVFNEFGDTIIHCGDISSIGNECNIKSFLEWFSNLDMFKNKIFIAGNHDYMFDSFPALAKEMIPQNIIYLENNVVTIDGITLFGSPNTTVRGWAFYKDELELSRIYKNIPNNIDVLITHTPPYGILDTSYLREDGFGSKALEDAVTTRIKPKYHCFGHVHDSYGIEEIDGTTYINSSQLNELYDISNEPIFFKI